jgi:hypothetical protein
VRVDQTHHALLLTLHHIIGDAGAMDALLDELMQAYGDIETAESQAPPLQYVDFAVWQREAVVAGRFHDTLEYWLGTLTPTAQPIRFRTEQPGDHQLSFNTAALPFDLNRAAYQRLLAVGKKVTATPFMTVLAAVKVFLSRICDSADVRVATNLAHRHHPALERLIGPCLNSAILRTDLIDCPTPEQAIRAVRETVLQAWAHQDLPFNLILEGLRLQEGFSSANLCRVMFLLEGERPARGQMPSLDLGPVRGGDDEHPELTVSTFDLVFNLREAGGALTGTVIYKQSVFTESACRELCRSLAEEMAQFGRLV